MDLPIRVNAPWAAEVHDSEFPPVEEIRRADLLVGFQLQRPRGRGRAADDQPVDMAVCEFGLIRNKKLFDQEMAAQFGRAEMPNRFGMAYLPDFDAHRNL